MEKKDAKKIIDGLGLGIEPIFLVTWIIKYKKDNGFWIVINDDCIRQYRDEHLTNLVAEIYF